MAIETYNFTTASNDGRYGPSQAQIDNEYSGTSLENDVTVLGDGKQEWSVPESGGYKITSYGAKGRENNTPNPGGDGAVISGRFSFSAGDTLQIIAGQIGLGIGNYGAGAGGGSFVVLDDGTPIVIAGGGGGAGRNYYPGDPNDTYPGASATYGTDSPAGTNPERDNYDNLNPILGGDDSCGGGANSTDVYGGSGGGGLVYNGTDSDNATGGQSFQNGGVGGQDNRGPDEKNGGFGGGGATAPNGGSGGGGYSGGAGTHGHNHWGHVGGGGGSFIHSSVTEPKTSDGAWDTTGNEPHSVYSGSVGNIGSFNSSAGEIVIEYLGTLSGSIFKSTNGILQTSNGIIDTE